MKKRFLPVLCLAILFTSSCSAGDMIPTAEQTAFPTPEILPSDTPVPTNTPIPATPSPELINRMCIPLEGKTYEELISVSMFQQPYETPWPGNDFPHPGLDFGYYGIEGLGVNAAMEGTVATILNDKMPYGNVVIIETPLDSVDPKIIRSLQIPDVIPTVNPAPRMNCPEGQLRFPVDTEKRSLYILYGHLKNHLNLNIGEKVACGQQIGEVGNTGWSSNPHLHFEARVGPSGARFDSMEYGTLHGTLEEKYNYCVWRVTGLFQSFDPLGMLSLAE